MTKADLIRAAGMESETIDYALPQPWVDAMTKLGVSNVAAHYVWHYPPNSLAGVPLPISELMLKAIERGALIPQEIVHSVMEMASSGGYSVATMQEAMNEACKNV